MSLTQQDREWMGRDQSLSKNEGTLKEEILAEVEWCLKGDGRYEGDDRFAIIESAIIRYLIETR